MKTLHLYGHDKTRLYVEYESGPPTATFVLCDGIGCDGFIWHHLRSSLTSIGTVVHHHMRGHGRSQVPHLSSNVTIGDLADDIPEILRQLCVTRDRPLILLGHSMGVQVVLEYLQRHGQEAAAAVLICGSFEHPASRVHYNDNLARALPLLKKVTQHLKSPVSFLWKAALESPLAFPVAKLTEVHPDRTDEAVFRDYLSHLANIDLDVFWSMLSAANHHSARPYLSALKLPCLVLSGEDDRMTPPELSGELCTLLPNARYVGIPGGTHIAPIEYPDKVNRAIMTFIKNVLSR